MRKRERKKDVKDGNQVGLESKQISTSAKMHALSDTAILSENEEGKTTQKRHLGGSRPGVRARRTRTALISHGRSSRVAVCPSRLNLRLVYCPH